MTTIVTRAGKGSPLTHTEVDTNFTNLNTNKLETAAIPLGTAAAPSISFLSDTNTGIYSPGADQVAVSTGGVQRINIEADGDINIDGGGVFYDATNNRLAIGTTSPAGKCVVRVSDNTGAPTAWNGNFLVVSNGDATTSSGLGFSIDSSSSSTSISSLTPGTGWLKQNYRANSHVFWYGDAGVTQAATIDSSGRLLIGTSTHQGNSILQVQGEAGAATAAGVLYLRRGLNTAAIGANVGADLGKIQWGANDGTIGAWIQCLSDATWSSTSDTPSALVFSTTADGASSPTERMRIGNAGTINFNSGKTIIYNTGDIETSISNDANANGFILDTGDGGAGDRPKFRIRYGTADQIYLDGSGNAQKPGGGSWAAISDSRAKENIVDYTSGLDQLKQIQPRSYRYIGNETTYIGLVAQEVEDAMPELVKLGEGKLPDGTEVTDFRTLDQTPLTFALINAVKEMAEQIDLLKAKVTALEGA